jgi:PPK2 family polyphosphate:nucleotide phosphotransferase
MELSVKRQKYFVDESLKLADFPTELKDVCQSDEDYEKLLGEFREELRERQEILFAQGRWSLLVVLQGMDTAGKDGTISHLMSGLNPQGVVVTSFRKPNEEEQAHDFLWRANRSLPRRGAIGIFNRSYYEELLVPRVHEKVLLAQSLPDELLEDRDALWKGRLKDIRHYEKYLTRNGTRVIKFFLHISKKEQGRRLKDRLREPNKHWKVQESDFHERGYWSEYQDAYQHMLRGTSTEECPWYVIPADDKKIARLIVGHFLVKAMKDLPLRYPKPTPEQEKFIEEMI